MAITYTWHNNEVQVYATLQDIHGHTAENVITGVKFVLRATHDSFIDPLTDELLFRQLSSVVYFDKETMEFGPNDGFISYDDVTLENIDSWVEELIGAEEITRMKLALEIMVNNETSPTYFWARKPDAIEGE